MCAIQLQYNSMDGKVMQRCTICVVQYVCELLRRLRPLSHDQIPFNWSPRAGVKSWKTSLYSMAKLVGALQIQQLLLAHQSSSNLWPPNSCLDPELRLCMLQSRILVESRNTSAGPIIDSFVNVRPCGAEKLCSLEWGRDHIKIFRAPVTWIEETESGLNSPSVTKAYQERLGGSTMY